MDWFSSLFSGETHVSETNVGPIVEELAAMRELLEHSLSVLQPRQDQLLANYPELKRLLDNALERAAGDTRRVWYRTWHAFESRSVVEKTLLLGGLYSPGLFRWESSHDMTTHIFPTPAISRKLVCFWPVQFKAPSRIGSSC